METARLKVVDSCVCYSCGRARMRLYYSGERIGACCGACKFTGIFLDDDLVAVPRKIFGLRLQAAKSLWQPTISGQENADAIRSN